jgi:hypothetical protein
MNAKTLVGIRIGCYTVWSLAVAWQTTMSGIEWASMGWEGKSCVIGGIVALWTGTMVAYFDKSMWRLEQNGNAPKP